MARYTGPSYKQARRVGFSISETGKELARRPYGPGQHGADRKGKPSDYGTQLKEKQKVRFMYGVNERQFHKTFVEAEKMQGIHGVNFLRLLESRLDNLVYRIGFASTRRGARQLVNHGHVTVNGKKVIIYSESDAANIDWTISGAEYVIEFEENNRAKVSVGELQIVIDYSKKKCANNKAIKCYGSDDWGRDVQIEWSEV